MDITSLSARDTATIDLLHPATGEPIIGADGVKATITLYGPGSRQHQQARANRDRRMMAVAMAANSKGKGKEAPADPAQERKDQAADLALCTQSITGWDYKGGTDSAAVEAAYADASVGWIADQASRALNDWASFLPEQPTA